jgi:hypothetical protein
LKICFCRDIRRHLEEIKQEQWQKLDSKQVLSACDKHLDNLQSLPKIVRIWDVYTFTEEDIKRIKVSLFHFFLFYLKIILDLCTIIG